MIFNLFREAVSQKKFFFGDGDIKNETVSVSILNKPSPSHKVNIENRIQRINRVSDITIAGLVRQLSSSLRKLLPQVYRFITAFRRTIQGLPTTSTTTILEIPRQGNVERGSVYGRAILYTRVLENVARASSRRRDAPSIGGPR